MNNSTSDIVFFDAKLKEEREYWLQQLGFEVITSSPLPDFARPLDAAPEYAELRFIVPADTNQKLRALAGSSSFLLYTVLLAALKVCLYKYTGHNTVLAGSPALKELKRANALAIVDHLHRSLTFRQLLLNVRETLLQAYGRQRYPISRLLKDLELDGVRHKCPLFDVAVALDDMHGELPEVETNISITFHNEGDGLECRVKFNKTIYSNKSIERFTEHYFNALRQGVEASEKQLQEFSLLTPAERQQLLVEWNNTERDFGAEGFLHRLFEAQVARTPNAVAVTFEGEQLTYNELNQKANQLARHLQTLSVAPETVVGIYMERSLEMVIGILGVLKSGAAYVPLDPEYPKERLSFILDDTRATVLLTHVEMRHDLPPFNGSVVRLDADCTAIALQEVENPVSPVTPDNLAYVIYTSGSTGRAKGVMISHRSICNRLLWMQDAYQFGPEDRLLQKTPFTFDASVWEFFVPLMSGARLTMAQPGGHREAGYLVDTIIAQEITVLQLVPSMLQVFLDEPGVENCHQLRHLFCGGELLSSQLEERFYDCLKGQLHNLYGPTEISIDASYWDCVREEKRRNVPIGRPIANMRLYVLDEQMQPVPIGVVGELFIGGVGLGRGYLNRPELTAEKFVPHPTSPYGGERLYRSGDLVFYHPDGSIEYVGRRDHQVKVHGFRIELGEIESALAAHQDVHEVVVLAREDDPGSKRLVAYVVGAEAAEISGVTLRNHLRTMLPEYMVPSSFVVLERLPLNANGKLNRRALPAPDHERPELENVFVLPRTAVEELLVDIWVQVLGIDRVGITDDFFDLGGHSLLATQIVSRVREAFHVELPLRDLFESPTIAGLAESIEAVLKGNEDIDIPPVQRAPRDQALPLSFTQQRLWLLDQLNVGGATYNLLSSLRLSGPLEVMAMEETLTEIVRRHEVLRTTFGMLNDEPVQVISPPQRLELSIFDLSNLSVQEQEAEIKSQVFAESQRPFDLSRGPLVRAVLLRLEAQEHVLLFTVHHVVSDGWSMGRLVDEVAVLYEAFRKHQPSPLPELSIQYGDYAVWQRNWLQGKVLDDQVAYWREQLAGAAPTLNLPADFPRPAVQSYQGANQRFQLPEDLTSKLKRLCKEEGVTMFMLLLAGWQTLLHRYTGQDDILVGSPIANRQRAEFEPLIGCLINTLVFRGCLEGNPSFTEFLQRMREVALGAYAHQDVPFDLLVEILQPERRANYTPFFQTVFVLQNAPMKTLQLSNLTLAPLEVDHIATQFDLILAAVEAKGELKGTLTYNTDIYAAETITEMLRDFRRLLEEIAADPKRRVLDIPLGESGQESFGVAPPLESGRAQDQFVL
jgi:amino acid adenylation domain-containing protein